MKLFEIIAAWDPEAGVWWAVSDELSLATEAPTLDELEVRAIEIAEETAEIHGLVAPGEDIEIRVLTPGLIGEITRGAL